MQEDYFAWLELYARPIGWSSLVPAFEFSCLVFSYALQVLVSYILMAAGSELRIPLPKGALSMLVQPVIRVSDDAVTNSIRLENEGFLLLASNVRYAYSKKDRAWIKAVANKFLHTSEVKNTQGFVTSQWDIQMFVIISVLSIWILGLRFDCLPEFTLSLCELIDPVGLVSSFWVDQIASTELSIPPIPTRWSNLISYLTRLTYLDLSSSLSIPIWLNLISKQIFAFKRLHDN